MNYEKLKAFLTEECGLDIPDDWELRLTIQSPDLNCEPDPIPPEPPAQNWSVTLPDARFSYASGGYCAFSSESDRFAYHGLDDFLWTVRDIAGNVRGIRHDLDTAVMNDFMWSRVPNEYFWIRSHYVETYDDNHKLRQTFDLGLTRDTHYAVAWRGTPSNMSRQHYALGWTTIRHYVRFFDHEKLLTEFRVDDLPAPIVAQCSNPTTGTTIVVDNPQYFRAGDTVELNGVRAEVVNIHGDAITLTKPFSIDVGTPVGLVHYYLHNAWIRAGQGLGFYFRGLPNRPGEHSIQHRYFHTDFEGNYTREFNGNNERVTHNCHDAGLTVAGFTPADHWQIWQTNHDNAPYNLLRTFTNKEFQAVINATPDPETGIPYANPNHADLRNRRGVISVGDHVTGRYNIVGFSLDSPDLVILAGDIDRVRQPNGSVKFGDEVLPSISPNGQHYAYHSGRDTIIATKKKVMRETKSLPSIRNCSGFIS